MEALRACITLQSPPPLPLPLPLPSAFTSKPCKLALARPLQPLRLCHSLSSIRSSPPGLLLLPASIATAATHPSHTFLTGKDGTARDEAYLETASKEEGRNPKDFPTAWLTDQTFLQCCEPGRQLKVAVLLSGGVDSSVALRLLCAAGHSCTAFYLKIWFQDNFENFWSSCPWDEDLKYAQEVCDQVGVELKIVHLTDEYWDKVVSDSIDKYRIGLTPNPDILCNSRIKFGVFLDYIQREEYDRCASGHYARVVRVINKEGKLQSFLHLSTDQLKDQTYFLSHLSQVQLSWLTFPLGCISKAQVRKLAITMGLPNRYRKDSQGICFLGKVKFNEFIARHIGEKEGFIIEAETGKYLGVHKGFWFFTLGQRQGLGLSNGPWFVVEKDTKHNIVFVSRDYNSIEKQRRTFRVHSISWFVGSPPSTSTNLHCKVRHGPKFYDCTFELSPSSCSKEGNNFTAIVTLSEDDQGLAPGQYAAFYQANLCLGSGIISENFSSLEIRNVSSEAILAARSSPNSSSMSKDLRLDLNNVHPINRKLKSTPSSSEKFTQISQAGIGMSNNESNGAENVCSYSRFSIAKILDHFYKLKTKIVHFLRIL